MGMPDDDSIQKMIQATKQMTLIDNGNGTWTQVSGLRTQTFPLNKEFTVYLARSSRLRWGFSGFLGSPEGDWICYSGWDEIEQSVEGWFKI